MHQVLLIDEILRNIFAQINNVALRPPHLRNFASCARVCKAWKDPALDFLWESLGTMDPLLYLIPGVTRVGDAYTIPDTISPNDICNFLSYAARVREVCQYSRKFCRIPPALLSLIIPQPSPDHILLPRLTTARLVLHDSFKRNIFPPTLYVSPRLRSLTIEISFINRTLAGGASHPGEALYLYMDAVARIASGLEFLRIRGRVCERMTETIATLTGLRTLSLCIGSDISPRTIAAIATFPRLEELRVHLDGMDADALDEALPQSGEAGQSLFPALHTLHVRSSPQVAEVLFTRLAPRSGLRAVRIESDFKPRVVDAWTPALALLADKAADTLVDLSIECLTNFCEVPDHAFPPKLHFTLATLAPLAKLTRLRKFHLDASVPADLTDADVATLAAWWPAIEDLGLWTRPVDAFDYPTYFTRHPRATLASLAVLAARCPNLRNLALALDIAALPPRAHPPLACASQGALERLTVGCARKAGAEGVDPEALAECIFRAFPALGRLDFESGGEASWGDVLEGYFGLQGTRLRVSVEECLEE
ncbi:hypothetical protein DENSPDRAFT_928720 [Dentipellis sp. KUC8613]|nr:hypothetical protein DENSPDRAFT_928720 [Dentipellis sp. KUC8613]